MGKAASAITGGGGGLLGATVGAIGAKKAAGTQQRAIENAMNAQRIGTRKAREQLSPYREFGLRALPAYEQALLGGGAEQAYQASPGYQFALEEGINSRERGAAARGGLLSGAQQKALTQYGQGLATQDYQQWLNNLYGGLGQFGYPAATGTANLYTGEAAALSPLMQGVGQAKAAGIYGVTQGVQQGIGSVMQAAGMMGGMGGGGLSGMAGGMAGGGLATARSPYQGFRSAGGLRGY